LSFGALPRLDVELDLAHSDMVVLGELLRLEEALLLLAIVLDVLIRSVCSHLRLVEVVVHVGLSLGSGPAAPAEDAAAPVGGFVGGAAQDGTLLVELWFEGAILNFLDFIFFLLLADLLEL
jgi:hypothetical protein